MAKENFKQNDTPLSELNNEQAGLTMNNGTSSTYYHDPSSIGFGALDSPNKFLTVSDPAKTKIADGYIEADSAYNI